MKTTASSLSWRYFIISVSCHLLLLAVFIISLEFSSPIPVIENTNEQDVISAVILGDTAKSKILPHETPAPKKVVEKKLEEKPIEKTIEKTDQKTIAIAKKTKKEKDKKLKDLLAKNLLEDIKKDINKKDIKKEAKKKQQELKSHFNKTLKEQTEESFRQSLLNEEIKLSSNVQRNSQGEVNKYKALILQAISEQWVIPTQANKKLTCELLIRLAPDGSVLQVEISKTSGDPSLDSSAKAAVLKASPLPVPNKPDAFEVFRHFALKVKPENMLSD